LPREVGLGGASNLVHEVVIFDAANRALERGRERDGARHHAAQAALRRAIHVDLPDAEPQALGLDAVELEAAEHVSGEHGELARPHARGHEHEQLAAFELEGARAIGDAWADHAHPGVAREGHAHARETVLARTVEDAVEGLGGLQRRALFRTSHVGPLQRMPSGLRSSRKPVGAAGSVMAPRRSATPART
jgi:hypothetical protein